MIKKRENWIYETYEIAPGGFECGAYDALSAFVNIWRIPVFRARGFRYKSDGLRGDWKRLGGDLRAALKKANERS
jgi:hypothetical protein